jgi:hypothetical protein
MEMGRMRGGLIGLLAVLALTGAAWAEDAKPDVTAGESKIADFKFPKPALVLEDDGTYRKALDDVSAQVKLKCGTLEAFGWSYDGIKKGQPLIDATIKAMTDAGYKIKAIAFKPFAGRQAFPGLATGKKRKIVLVWVADAAGATLVMCDGLPVGN